jgi:hypothetical protein
MTATCYLIGVPGAGKSTALVGAVDLLGWGEPEARRQPFAHAWYEDARAVLLGKQDVPFPGTDTLSLGVNPRAVEFVRTAGADLIVGEGDRLANRRFLCAAADAGGVVLITFDLPAVAAFQRMLDRAEALGVAPQLESWWRGRATKTANLRRLSYPGLRHETLDASRPREEVAERVAEVIERMGATSVSHPRRMVSPRRHPASNRTEEN